MAQNRRNCRVSQSREFPEMKYKAEKVQAVLFYQQNKIPQTLEALLNKMYKEKPDDLYGYMADYFFSLSKEPVISSLSACEGLDSVGEKSIVIDLYCIVAGVNKLITISSLSEEPYPTPILLPPAITPTKGGGKRTPKGQVSNSGSPSLSNSHGSGTIPIASLKPGERRVTCVITVQTHISAALKGLPVKQQRQVDQALERLRDTVASKKVLLHPSSFLATSCAVALAGAQLSMCPLFLHLASFKNNSAAEATSSAASSATTTTATVTADTLCSPQRIRRATCSAKMVKDTLSQPGNDRAQSSTTNNERSFIEVYDKSPLKSLSVPEAFAQPVVLPEVKYTMPIPVVAALGRSSGKLRIKEFCVLPLPGSPMPQQIKMLERLHAELGKLLSTKFGPNFRCTLPNGAYCPTLDKLDQGVELIRETVTGVDLQLEVDVAMFIDVGADCLYDEDKGKYELVAGQWKNTDEVISIYSELLHSSTGLLGFIDPLHPKDLVGWKKLRNKLGSKCLILADNALKKGLPLAKIKKPVERRRLSLPGVPGMQVDIDELNGVEDISCAALTLEHTISHTMDKASHLKGCSHNVMVRVPSVQTVNTVVVDLAVATQCRFIRLGAPVGINTTILNRILRIRQELISRKQHEPVKAHLFRSNFEQ